MQKLVWRNSIGNEIDLTSAPYGITTWEGFSNTSLNIQSQQVPFQDGGVFLDALMEQRELSVTLAIQDKNNLENRYKYRRELIHILNPKLGEGYLIYTNDFISKRIKCVAQIPLFETHNSNDSGTPKASLAWTACEPYWEDLEEKQVTFDVGVQPIVKNEGDIPCQVKMDWYTNYAKNPSVTNLHNGKKIKVDGNLTNNLLINTNSGQKTVYEDEIKTNLIEGGFCLYKVSYIDELEKFVAIGWSTVPQSTQHIQFIMTSIDGDTWSIKQTDVVPIGTPMYSKILKKVIAPASNGKILLSTDGETWESVTVTSDDTVRFYGVAESEDKIVLITSKTSGTDDIFVTSDGETFSPVSSGFTSGFGEIAYVTFLHKFIIEAVISSGSAGEIESFDGTSWSFVTIIENSTYAYELSGISFSDDLHIVIIGQFYSNNGVNWTKIEINVGMQDSLCYTVYSKLLKMFVGYFGYGNVNPYKIAYSSDGINFTLVNVGTLGFMELQALCFSETLGFFIGGYYNKKKILKSYNGTEWFLSYEETRTSLKLYYDSVNKKYFAYGGWLEVSDDLNSKEWSRISFGNASVYNIFYSKVIRKYIALVGDKTIRTSSDLVNWESYDFSSLPSSFTDNSIAESENTVCVIVKSGKVIKTTDGENWTVIDVAELSSSSRFNCIIYNDVDNQFVIGVTYSNILVSYDGESWTSKGYFYGDIKKLIYCKEKSVYVATVSTHNTIADWGIYTSTNLTNWVRRKSTTYPYLYTDVCWSSLLQTFIVCGAHGEIFKSTDGINWVDIENPYSAQLNSVIFNFDEACFYIMGVPLYKLAGGVTSNAIAKISTDSDMGFNLELGDNRLRINYDGGEMSVRIKYRQRYIGV